MAETRPEQIHYLCQRCGNCCRWPGDVWVNDAEITRISHFLGSSQEEFINKFTRLTANRQGLSITEKPNGECIFLEDNRCAIQPVKPGQCSGFPNAWNFPGWRNVCEAIAVPASATDIPTNSSTGKT